MDSQMSSQKIEDWVDPDELGSITAKVLEECQNGLLYKKLFLPVLPGYTQNYISETVHRYTSAINANVQVVSNTCWQISVPRVIMTLELMETVLVVSGWRLTSPEPIHPYPQLLMSKGDYKKPLWRVADAIIEADSHAVLMSERELQTLLESESRLLATLSADILNRRGIPAVPRFVQGFVPEPYALKLDKKSAHDGWESHISVDEYALFEATHPAYARQVFALAQAIHDLHGDHLSSMVEIGPGPGLTTIMLAELFPDTLIDAVDPSPASFQHLVRNIDGYRVSAHNSGIGDYQCDQPYPVAASVGTSHHLDTRVFLRSMRRLVEPGGLILIADEMISPFATEHERIRFLVDHHLSYIEEALANIDAHSLPDIERRRLAVLRSIERTRPETLKELLKEVRLDRTLHQDNRGPWQRVRLAVLELEALVAGIDYDVERKTYPDNFVTLADDEGLELLGHRRVHRTLGDSVTDAGTHVFAFRNPY